MTDFETIIKKLDEKESGQTRDFSRHYVDFKGNIERGLLYLIDAMFPTYAKHEFSDGIVGNGRYQYLMNAYGCILAALKVILDEEEAEKTADKLLCEIPEIYDMLKKDVTAGYEGDPACKSVDEVILAYPAFIAISTYRIAHVLYREGQPLIARIMSEYAHRKTGIDIHPGAVIGEYFFIDHGTGVVIGETTVIGKHVKLYQHVTLGAKSFAVAEDGTLVKNIKRHPNVGDNVVIYAGATILGGDVTIGDNCVIGGNVWLTHSTEPGTTITQRQE